MAEVTKVDSARIKSLIDEFSVSSIKLAEAENEHHILGNRIITLRDEKCSTIKELLKTVGILDNTYKKVMIQYLGEVYLITYQNGLEKIDSLSHLL